MVARSIHVHFFITFSGGIRLPQKSSRYAKMMIELI